jgi:hypothetical protein
MLQAECPVVCLVEWAVWVVWVEWECNPTHSLKNLKKGSFYCPFFLIKCYKIIMSKRYSGKSFKDSSVSKKPKLSLKEKRKQKKEKTKKS